MFIFNPEHDLCLANGSPYFVPPASALSFGKECSSLVHFMSGLEMDEITPWGWNGVLRENLIKSGVDEKLLPSSQQIGNIRALSDRSLAAESYLDLFDMLGEEERAICVSPEYRTVAGDLHAVEAFLEKEGNIVMKSVLSGSGKGIRFVREALSHSDIGWCKRLLARHGAIVLERRLDVVREFAMLFEINGGVFFRGYSLFFAKNGIYSGNLLASDGYIFNDMCRYAESHMLEKVRERIAAILEKRFLQAGYRGYVGVDQFFFSESLGHAEKTPQDVMPVGYVPLAEFNVRMTMGLLARNIYDNCKEKVAAEYGIELGDGSHSLVICRNEPRPGCYSYKFASSAELSLL